MNNRDGLRTQIIEAMTNHFIRYSDDFVRCQKTATDAFDEAIMPVLDAAMKAGELLLHRATTPQKPVNEGIVEWLERCCHVIASLHHHEPTVSKRELLNVLYQLEEGANIALADARKVKPETDSEKLGKLLRGQSTIPVKG